MVGKNNETFTVSYTNKDIMDKLEVIHTAQKITNGTVKNHTKLIYGSYGFTLTVLISIVSILISLI